MVADGECKLVDVRLVHGEEVIRAYVSVVFLSLHRGRRKVASVRLGREQPTATGTRDIRYLAALETRGERDPVLCLP